ncbi:MAG: ORF6C domain-containing protein [Chloroflexota bacterium]|nr:ORF6C domain-containing protein [Chloroflexota bacterium]
MLHSDVSMPQAQRTIDFYGDPITVAVMPNDEVYVPLRPIAEFLGLDWSSQLQRIRRDDVLERRVTTLVITTTDDSRREMICLPLDLLPGWLFGITASRVRPEIAPKLTRYREECFRVLWRAYQADALAAVGAREAAPATGLAHLRDLGFAMAHMAEQQLALEQKVMTQDVRLDRAATLFRHFDQRLLAVEEQVHPAAFITEAQAAELSQRVKAVVTELTRHNPGPVHYQTVFGELYRRFRITSYKRLSQGQFEEAMQFLDNMLPTPVTPDATT